MNNIQYFFIPTDDEKYWNLKTPFVVFADRGCLRFSQKGNLKNLSYDFLPPLFSDNKDLKEKNEYLEDIKEEISSYVVDFLNRYHKLSCDVCSWNLLIHYWLSLYINEMYRCFVNVKRAKELYPNITSYGVDLSNRIFIKDTSDFNNTLFNSPDYGMQFYTYAFNYWGIPYTSIERDLVQDTTCSKKTMFLSFLQEVRRIFFVKKNLYAVLKKIYIKLFFSRHIDLLGIDVYLPDAITNALRAKTNGKIKFVSSVPIKKLYKGKTEPNYILRENLFIEYKGHDDFVDFVCKYILSDIPIFWLEKFYILNKLSKRYYPKNVANIITSTCWACNDIEKNFFREQRLNNKSKIIEVQHGGNYGLLPLNDTFNANYVDIFYTWGWTSENSFFKRMPAGKLISLRKYKYTDQTDILYSSTCCYKRRLTFQFLQDGYSYTKRIKLFLGALSPAIRENVVFRKYVKEFNWEISDQIREFYPSVKLQGWDIHLYEAISKSKVFFVDNLNTTWIEAISIGIPTIMCFDIDNYVLSESAKKILEEMAQVGIFYSSPINAAKFIENSYAEIFVWWNSRKVQSVVNTIKNLYGWVPLNSDEIWQEELLSLIR